MWLVNVPTLVNNNETVKKESIKSELITLLDLLLFFNGVVQIAFIIVQFNFKERQRIVRSRSARESENRSISSR